VLGDRLVDAQDRHTLRHSLVLALGHNLKFAGRGWTADDLFESTSTAAHREPTVTAAATSTSGKSAGEILQDLSWFLLVGRGENAH
jgi:hypothetical protein